MKRYRNLSEMDSDLKLLKLKMQLEREKINLDLTLLKRNAAPQALARELAAEGLKRISIIRLIRSLFRKRS